MSRALALTIGLSLFSLRADAAALNAEVYLVYWPAVGGDANRVELDSFMNCLINGTNYAGFFAGWGGVQLKYGGSVSVTTQPPGGHFGICDNDVSYTNQLINSGELPKGSTGYMPLYVFMMPSGLIATNCASGGGCGSWPNCGQVCQMGTCGLNTGDVHNNGSMTYQEVWVTTYWSCCWQGGRTDLNVETEYIQHEVAEALGAALGVSYGGQDGDGCEVSGRYDFTGCPSQAGKPADWYVLQKLSNQSKGSCNFTTSYTGLGCGSGQLHDACSSSSACCAPLECQLWTLSGSNPSDVCCLPVGASCVHNTDCCGGPNCINGKCACVPSGQWCLQNSDCCAGLVCDPGVACVTPPPDAGADAGRDGGEADGGADGGPNDAGTPDGGPGEGNPDGGIHPPPAGAHASCGCSGVPGPALLVLLLSLRARRRR